MRISWNWLRTLIETDLSPHEAAAILTSTGLEVESVELLEPVRGMLAGVVVGQVLGCEKHPDADRLRVCQVELGSGTPVAIVCGAPNVAEGQRVLVATVGTTLHPSAGEPITIKRSKIRGVESNGMICAEDELGLGSGHAGILVLDPSAVVGTAAAVLLGLRVDHALEIGLTPNRADAMSHVGVARDLAAALTVRTGRPVAVKWPDTSAFRMGEGTGIPVEVLAPAACSRYAGITLSNVKVASSPAWLQERLRSIGLKPINNVVDVTNFVQHELGQPLHAFDAARLAGGRVVVRLAKEGEPFRTLDGKDRLLSAQDLVIADAEKPACLAGVFGGADSGVGPDTTKVFLESARFDPATVRKTARRHGLNTDASFRFERGVDPGITITAVQRAVLLLCELTGARVEGGVQEVQQMVAPWATVELDPRRVQRAIGVEVPAEEIVQVLRALDCRVQASGDDRWQVSVPPYRVDVTREADLVEEVIRIIGFDRVPIPARLSMPAVPVSSMTLDGQQGQFASHLSARGFREVMTPSLVNGQRVVDLGGSSANELIRMKNPLSAELDTLRPSMLFGMLQAAAHNIARQQRDLRFFEKGRTYTASGSTAREQDRTAMLITGARNQEGWRGNTGAAAMPDLKAEVELLLERLHVPDPETSPSSHPLFSNFIEVRSKNTLFAGYGIVHPAVLKAFDIAQPVFFAELHDAAWFSDLAGRKVEYAEVPRFPAVRRDLSLLLDGSITFAELERAARRTERKILRDVDLFDVYEGDKLPAGKKSYALRFTLQDVARTLTDEQVERAMARIRKVFEDELGAQLRA